MRIEYPELQYGVIFHFNGADRVEGGSKVQEKKGEFQFVGEINESTPPLCVDFGREGVNIYSIRHNDKIILAEFDTKEKKVINLHIVSNKEVGMPR